MTSGGDILCPAVFVYLYILDLLMRGSRCHFNAVFICFFLQQPGIVREFRGIAFASSL